MIVVQPDLLAVLGQRDDGIIATDRAVTTAGHVVFLLGGQEWW